MAYVITDACVKDYVCAAECATAAIAPASAGDPGCRRRLPVVHQSR